jgi:hypothetical protein
MPLWSSLFPDQTGAFFVPAPATVGEFIIQPEQGLLVIGYPTPGPGRAEITIKFRSTGRTKP